MSCRLLVKNIANSYSTGDVVSVNSGDHSFGKYESKTKFIDSGLIGTDWPREFVIVNIIDAENQDYEYLLDKNSSEERRYYLAPQGADSPFYQQLLDVAEVTVNKQIFNSLIIDRGA
jgi:hypothetical protein